jgi:hypothetical protein
MLGGIEKIIKTYFGHLINAISDKVFKNAILSDLFFVKQRKESDELGERKQKAGAEGDVKIGAA